MILMYSQVLSLLFDFCRGVEKASVDEVYVDLSRHVAVMIQWLLAAEDPKGESSLELSASYSKECLVEGGPEHLTTPNSNRESGVRVIASNRSHNLSSPKQQEEHPRCTLFPFCRNAPPLPELSVQRSLLPVLKERLFGLTEIKDPKAYHQIASAARRFVSPTTNKDEKAALDSGRDRLELLAGTLPPEDAHISEAAEWRERVANGIPVSVPLTDDEWTLENFWLVCGAILAARLRKEVQEKLAFTMSGGVAHNKVKHITFRANYRKCRRLHC